MVALNKFFQKVSWDLVGFSTSTLCAIHCVVFPFLILFGSIGSFGFVHNHELENAILLISAIIGLISLVPSYLNHHRKLTPIRIFVSGLTLIILSRFPVSMLLETILTTTGACTVAFAHLINWKYCKSYCAHAAEDVNSRD